MSGAGSPRAMPHRTVVTPPQRRRDYVPNSKSSDSLPDLSDILPGRVDARLRTGSRAVALPETVAAGFQSTSMLLKYNLLKLQHDEDESVIPVKGKKARVPQAKTNNRTEKSKSTVAKESAESNNEPTRDVFGQKRRSSKRKSDNDKAISALDPFGYQEVGLAQIEAATEAVANAARTERPEDPSSRKRRKIASEEHADAKGDGSKTGTSTRPHREKRTVSHPQHSGDLEEIVSMPKDSPTSVTETVELSEGVSKSSKDDSVSREDFPDVTDNLRQNDIFEVPSSSPGEPLVDMPVQEGKTRQVSKKSVIIAPHLQDQKQTTLPVVTSTGKVIDLVSEPEVRGKSGWTPPKSAGLVDGAEAGNELNVQAQPQQEMLEPPAFDFSELCQTFTYDRPRSASFSPDQNIQGTTMPSPARRIDPVPDLHVQALTFIIEQPGPAVFVAAKMEIVEVKQSPKKKASRNPPKPKLKPKPAKDTKKSSPRKGPMTITARSIARYAKVDLEKPEQPATVSPHFSPAFDKPQEQVAEDPVRSTDQPTKTVKPRKPRKSRAKDEAQVTETAKKKPTKAKNVLIVAPKLVSREQHEAKLKRQDLLFGTSSQLRQEGSPQYVREMQQALQMSMIDEQEGDEGGSSPIPLRTTEAIRRTGRKLWSEGANIDTESGWQDISDVDVQLIPIAAAEDAAEHIELAPILNPGAILDACTSGQSPVPSHGFWPSGRSSLSPVPHSAQLPSMATAIVISSSPRLSTSPPRVVLRTLSTNTKSPAKRASSKGAGAKKTASASVNHDEQTIASQGTIKSPKGRPPKNVQNKQSSSPTKARGRPRKATASSLGPQTPRKRGRPPKLRVARDNDDGFQHIDDIEDSEPDHTPSPPQKRGSPTNSQTLPLSTATVTDKAGKKIDSTKLNAQHPNWPAVRAKLFPEIARAVTSAPRTGNIKKPSWHEKMLLYDPIVLEDLTAWLNDEGLRVEGKDGTLAEISCWMVQSWCEMNSVCCLWKGGLRGGVRVKY